MEGVEMTAIDVNGLTPDRCHRAFVPADLLREFRAEILDGEWCRRWILKRLHGDHPRCPGCAAPVSEKSLQRFWSGMRIKCDSCGKFFWALTDTFLSGSHLSFQEIVLLGVLLAMADRSVIGISDKQIGEILEISTEAVRIWRHKFEAIGRLQDMKRAEILQRLRANSGFSG
jgi:transposase-like protein